MINQNTEIVHESIDRDGFAILKSVFELSEIHQLIETIGDLDRGVGKGTINSRGTFVASRNVIELVPDIIRLWQRPILVDLLAELLGNEVGLVRVLFFDKPSSRSWSLPFHKDMTIAVRDNSHPSNLFNKPTRKAGVDDVEAPESLLKNMLTLRIHLDDVTDDNGPLQVIPGSHLSGKQNSNIDARPIFIRVAMGDVLAMRPLVSHASGHSNPEKNLRRRILHLEFSGDRKLPDGYQWQHFLK